MSKKIPGESVQSQTILVVDDDSATRKLISLILRQGGYGVLEAGDSETAADIHRNHKGEIDLLLTDVSLPGPSGCDLAADLCEAEPRLPVLFMSGLPGAEVETFKGMPKEGNFLQKPFGVAELLQRVQDLSRPRQLRTA